MWTKFFKSAAALIMAGTIIATMPVTSSEAAVTANDASVVSTASSEWYYNMLSSSTVEDGEYIFYHPYSKTVMTNQLNSSANRILSVAADNLSYSVKSSAIPSEYRYKVKAAGNGSYYIINNEGNYLNIPKYNAVEFTSVPTALEFENHDDGGVIRTFIKKYMGSYYCTLSFNSSGYVTAYDHRKGSDNAQIITLLKYDSKPTAYTLKKLSEYGIKNYDTNREFTPKRVGDMYSYTSNKLKMSGGLSNRTSTGIWASPGETLKIYVQHGSGDMKPMLEFTQHISNADEFKSVQLKGGINEITVPQLHEDFSDYEMPVEPGGCIYIINPYDTQQQGKDLKIYIEGGDRIPVFRKGDNTKKFAAELKEYYTHYKNGQKGYHNAAELVSEHIIITITLEQMYEAYITNGLDPQAVAESWDKYMESLYEFDGISPQEYKNFVIHIKLNQVNRPTPDSEALAYASSGFIGIRNDVEMPSSALTAQRRGWGYTHEIGHLLDIRQREYQEVSNNMWAMQYVMKNETRYETAIKKPLDYLRQLATNDETTLWSGYVSSITVPYNPMALNMFWDLEVYHNGYWKELDTMFRNGSSGNSKLDSYVSGMSTEEKIAAYSSKILGIDLTYYFKRYGFIKETSSSYKSAITSVSLSNAQPKIWYYDDEAYTKPLNSNLGKNGNIICSPDQASNSIFFTIPEEYKDAHLGFEIVKNGKVIDFVWDYKYTATDIYSSNYTINAYDRSLNLYNSVNCNVTQNPQQYAVICGGNYYSSLKKAVDAAPNGSTVYVAESTAINEAITIDGKDITIMPLYSDRKIVIYNNVKNDIFTVKNGGSLTVKSGSRNDDMFVFDGCDQMSGSLFRLYSGGTLDIEKGVTVRRFGNNNGGSAVYANESAIILRGCIIEYNYTTSGTVYLTSTSVLACSENTIFRQNKAEYAGSVIYIDSADSDVYLKDTVMYKNFCNNKNTGSTIYAKSGYLSIGNGTSISSNFSDWYNLNSAMYISSNAKAEFSGNVDITDNVTTAGKIYIDPEISGVLNVRTSNDFTKTGNTVAVPMTGYFSKNTLSTVKYNHGFCSLINQGNSLIIGEIPPLVNNSSISSSSITLGSTVTVRASALGGTGSYNYAFYYKKKSDTKWTTKQDFKANSTVSIKPAKATSYDICAKVKDTDGTIEKKYFTVTVKQLPLSLKASVSADSIYIGNTFNIKASASGGAGSYTYAFYYKKTSDTKWTTKQDFKANASVSIKPAKSSTYNVCAKVKDSSGTVVKKYFEVKVITPLSITAVIPSTAKLGNTVPVKISVSGGTAPYTYAVYYKKTTDTKWVTKQDFKNNSNVSIKPAKTAEYEICVKVKDSTGTVTKKYFYVKVS